MADIFAPVPVDLQETDPLKIYAEKFGDGQNIDVAKLAKAKFESDNFIKQLEAEAQEMRKEVSSKATIDEIMTQIRTLGAKPPEVKPPQEPQNPPASPEELETLVAKMLERRSAEDRVKSNRQIVEEKVLAKWGADAQININKKAKELGVTVEHLQKIALDTPTVFFALTGLDKEVQAPPPLVAPRSREQAPALPNANGERTRSYYLGLKQRNPTEYFSAKVRQQEMKDALALGERFFDA